MPRKITAEQNIWFPGAYRGREDYEYSQKLSLTTLAHLIELVQKRAKEDGEWALRKGFVGDRKNLLRLVTYVSDERNIRREVAYIRSAKMLNHCTIDFFCRDLAMIAQRMLK